MALSGSYGQYKAGRINFPRTFFPSIQFSWVYLGVKAKFIYFQTILLQLSYSHKNNPGSRQIHLVSETIYLYSLFIL